MTLPEQLQRIAARYQTLRPESPRPLTIPAIFRRDYDENFISHYLAYILDPNRNGIGTGPIIALCKLYGRDIADLPLQDVVIHREYVLGSGRIDLLLEIKDQWVLGIENKIFASEGTNQTSYYASQMAINFPDVERSFIFLTRGKVPARSEVFKLISYKDLLDKLKTIQLDNSIDNRKRVLWEDFLEHLEVYIVMTNSAQFEFSQKTQLYLENYQILQDMERTFNNDWREAIGHLEQYLPTLMADGPWAADGEWQIDSRKSGFCWLLIRNKHWNKNGFNIEFWWQLTPENWLGGKIPFKVDVRGNSDRTTPFFAQMDTEYRKAQNQHILSDIIYRPANRSVCIVQKDYAFDSSIAGMKTVFAQTISDFQFLVPIIDEIVANITP